MLSNFLYTNTVPSCPLIVYHLSNPGGHTYEQQYTEMALVNSF